MGRVAGHYFLSDAILQMKSFTSVDTIRGYTTTPPARFYVLSALPGGEAASPVAAAERGLAIGIGPVTFPKYLDRPQIVTSTSPYALNMAEFDRWAEPLESNFVRVLAENLALLIPMARFVVAPWPR